LYANLPPGNYVFHVRGANGDGVWNMTGASFSFAVLPPYWETWWFRLLIIATLAGLLTLLYTYRVRHLLAVERLRTRIASDLHDDVGSALTKIAIHSEVIQTTDSLEKIAASSRMIGAMSREIVGTLSDIVWSIDARHDAFHDLVGRVRTFALEILGAREMSVHFTTDGLDLSRRVNAEVRQNLYLICKEAINNIARHSGATEVWIAMTDRDDRLRVSIEDNGAGLASDNFHAGHGLRNMQMRAGRIGGTIVFDKGRGMRIVVEV
jgi:signal transduction histidine kinase